jgi:ABC-type phosphate/phosphonate transport system ATPase subunit
MDKPKQFYESKKDVLMEMQHAVGALHFVVLHGSNISIKPRLLRSIELLNGTIQNSLHRSSQNGNSR